MISGWAKVQLAEVIAERKEVPSADDLATGKVRIVAKVGFNDGRIQFRADGQTKTGMILIRPGDLILSGINAAKGAIAVYGEDNTEPVAATIHYGAYIPNKARVDVLYLWWLLRSRAFRNLLLQYVPGGIKTELKAKRLLPIPIPLPPLSEQRRIVARIEELRTKIEEARHLREQNRAFVTALMETFIQDIISRFPGTCPFAEVITFKPRSGPSFPTDPDWKGTPVLMPSAVTGFGVDPSKVEFGPGNERISEKDRLMPGDILIARGNKQEQVGNAGIVPEQAKGWVCANLLMRARVDWAKVDPRFCIYWLRSPHMRAHVKQSMTGTNPNIQKINQRIILDYPFPRRISLTEQRRIVAHLDDLQAKVDALKRLQAETAAELNGMLPSILDKAFKGELQTAEGLQNALSSVPSD
jgi:type I restriction enzyme, S subunit